MVSVKENTLDIVTAAFAFHSNAVKYPLFNIVNERNVVTHERNGFLNGTGSKCTFTLWKTVL